MGKIKVGDIVSRKSYGGDIFFKVVDIIDGSDGTKFVLRGISFRIEADAPESDLEVRSDKDAMEYARAAMLMSDDKSTGASSSKGGIKRFFAKRTS